MESKSPASPSALSAESLRSLAEASGFINSTLDLKTVLDRIAESAAKVMRAQAGSVLLLDKHRSKLVFVSATGERAEVILGKEFDADLGITSLHISGKQPHQVHDVRSQDHQILAAHTAVFFAPAPHFENVADHTFRDHLPNPLHGRAVARPDSLWAA